MAGKGRAERGSRSRGAAASAVVPLPRSGGDRPDLARLIPSGQSLLLASAVVVGVFAAYWGARSTSVFAVQRVEVQGAPPDVAREVRAATADIVGRSLLAVDDSAIEGKVRLLPSVVAASVDRAFPHTLVIKVAAEHPVAVARRGDHAWLVTASGRIVREVTPRDARALPRIWLPRSAAISVGGELPTAYEPAARTLGAARDLHFAGRVKGIRLDKGEITLALRSGRTVLLGEQSDVRVKLAVAAQILPQLDSSLLYLDVSVPERPVASADNSQPSG